MKVDLQVVNSDNFNELSHESQLLYMFLAVNATEDGFVYNPRGIARGIGLNEDNLVDIIANLFASFTEGGIKIHTFPEYIRALYEVCEVEDK